MSEPLRQLYDKQGRPIPGKGGERNEVFDRGLLHGASHLWLWRRNGNDVEVLLQKRSQLKALSPGSFDVSVGGHIDLGEEPLQTVLRETSEEIGVVIPEQDITFISVHHRVLPMGEGRADNEFLWTYIAELRGEHEFVLQEGEVELVKWFRVMEFANEVRTTPEIYVDHGALYYEAIIEALEKVSSP